MAHRARTVASRGLAVLVAVLLATTALASAAHAEGTASLSGRVTNVLTTHALAGATVTNVDLGTTTTTDADGTFTFSGLAPGSYRVSVARAGYWTALSEWYALLDGESRTGADLALNPELTPYSSTPAPTISGVARVGAELFAHAVDWAPQQDSFEYSWTANGLPIAGATTDSLELAPDLLGQLIAVAVTGTRIEEDDFYQARQLSTTAVVVEPAAVVGSSPSVIGARRVGEELEAVPGSWSPVSTVLTYQWYRGSTPISGATQRKYTLRLEDAGATVNVVVTGHVAGLPSVSRPGRQFFATADGLFAAPTGLSLAGSPAVGTPLSVIWSAPFSPAPTTVGYQWSADGAPVAGATAATYVPSALDIGKSIGVVLTAARAGFEPLAVEVGAGAPVVPGTIASLSAPVMSAPRVGRAATTTTGTWSTTGTSFAYQWYSGGMPVSTAATYTPSGADLGAQLSVTVTAYRTGYVSASRSSNQAAVLEALFTTTPRPTISGSPVVGGTVSVSTGSWSPSGASFSYQWKVGGLTVGGATGSTYSVRPTDADRSVTVVVTASKQGYSTTSMESAASASVKGRAYSLCEYLLADYPYGVMRDPGVKDAVKKNGATQYLEPYGPPFVSASVYALNASGRDADKDGIACEQRP